MKMALLLRRTLLILTFVGSLGANLAHASITTYSFDFSSANGLYGVGTLDSTGARGSISGSGTLTANAGNTAGLSFNTYEMSNFVQLNTGAPTAFRFNAYGIVFTANYSAQYIDPYPDNGALSYSPTSGTNVQSVFIDQYGPNPPPAAPEIDGSLAPKVSFLLGCLFLMFSRKKQISNPTTSAR